MNSVILDSKSLEIYFSRFARNVTMMNDNCDECLCMKDGVAHCKPKVCPPCSSGLRSQITLDCSCICKHCEPGSKICPSSQTCVPVENWCDGIEHCPDDEINCRDTLGKPLKAL